MKKLLYAIFSKQQPPSFTIPEYVGETFERITTEYPIYKSIPYSKKEKSLILEIQSTNATLAFVIKNDICVEAYRFTD